MMTMADDEKMMIMTRREAPLMSMTMRKTSRRQRTLTAEVWSLTSTLLFLGPKTLRHQIRHDTA